jgi:hypothetical protein
MSLLKTRTVINQKPHFRLQITKHKYTGIAIYQKLINWQIGSPLQQIRVEITKLRLLSEILKIWDIS